MQPSPELLHEVRIGFLKQRSSLNAFCTFIDDDYANVRRALLGEWQGDKAQTLCKKVIEAADVEIKLEVEYVSQLDLLSATESATHKCRSLYKNI